MRDTFGALLEKAQKRTPIIDKAFERSVELSKMAQSSTALSGHGQSSVQGNSIALHSVIIAFAVGVILTAVACLLYKGKQHDSRRARFDQQPGPRRARGVSPDRGGNDDVPADVSEEDLLGPIEDEPRGRAPVRRGSGRQNRRARAASPAPVMEEARGRRQSNKYERLLEEAERFTGRKLR